MRLTVSWRTLALGATCALLPLMAQPAPPRLDDYSHGMTIEPIEQQPLVQLPVPDDVYQRVVNDDLSDVRVFNANGVPVPHALCSPVSAQEPTVSQESLPVYRLQDVPGAEGDGTRIQVQTPGGTEVSVQGTTSSPAVAQTSAYVIDARAVVEELRALQFDWHSPDGASEARVSIQASDDLNEWRTIVARSTLLTASDGSQQLQRHRVNIPQAHYEYLRVERADRGPPLDVAGVIAERVTPAPIIEPVWMYASVISSEPTAYVFDSGRHAPFTFARLTQLADNSSMHVAIESRSDAKASWKTQWTGEVYSIVSESERKASPPGEFAATTDQAWRVRLTKQADSFYQAPTLELGYRPARLRFLAQGPGPYTLAFGSRRAEPVVGRACDALLGGLKQADIHASVTDGMLGGVRTLGGEDALRPLPKQTPIRQIVLWGVLVVAVGALVAMGLSLLRRANPPG